MIDIYINIVLESNLLVPLYRDTLFSQKYKKKKMENKTAYSNISRNNP